MGRITELFKTLLICLLTVTMVLLTLCFFVVTLSSDALSPEDLLYELTASSQAEKSDSDQTGTLPQTAAFPCQIAYVCGMGQLYMPISSQEYDDALDSTEQFLEEAIASCSDYSKCTETDYILSLLGQGILWVYDYPLPFYMLSSWAEYSYSGKDITVSSIFVYSDSSAVNLLIKGSDGSYHRFMTQADEAYIARVCASVSPNGVISAMTNSGSTNGDVPILSGGLSLPTYTLSTGYNSDDGEISRKAMTALDINPYLSSVYRDGDATVYIEGSSRLHMYADRHLSYSTADENGGVALPLAADLSQKERLIAIVEGVRSIVFPLWESLSSPSVRLSLSTIEETDDGLTVYFDAYIGGCYISRGELPAAAARIEDGKLVGLSIYPLSLQRKDYRSVIPYAQAQAAADSDAVLRVQYVLQEDMTVAPILADVKEGE